MKASKPLQTIFIPVIYTFYTFIMYFPILTSYICGVNAKFPSMTSQPRPTGLLGVVANLINPIAGNLRTALFTLDHNHHV